MGKHPFSLMAARRAAQQMADETGHMWHVVQYGWADTALYHVIPHFPPAIRDTAYPTRRPRWLI